MSEDRQGWTTRDVIGLAYGSYNRAKPHLHKKPDRDIRHPEYTRRILDALGSPDKAAYSVAVTGSKGKGSHSIFLAGMLERLGFRVGLFTGPHLVDFMERFRIDGTVMSESKFRDYMFQVNDVASSFDLPEDHYIGPVGLLAAVAALWFREQRTTLNVVECGRGALHDDVNQWFHQGAIISPVFLEHMHELGPMLLDVATEKAGVLTPSTEWVASYEQSAVVSGVIHPAANAYGIRLSRLSQEFSIQNIIRAETEMQMDVQLGGGRRCQVSLPSEVDFLATNAAVACQASYEVWRQLRDEGTFPNRLDLSDIRLPGRMHVLRRDPLCIVDGTIHHDSAEHVASFARRQKEQGFIDTFGAVVSVPDDKDGAGVLKALAGVVDWVVIARAHNPHLHFEARETDILAQQAIREVFHTPYIEEAMAIAEPRLTKRDGLLLLGTQSFVGDVLRFWSADSTSIWQ